ncbi:unnamed protein product [Adineta steineri]|uniref:Tudor domain-containing protein n=1 Tax=Adineta steineri TaxID=433720 RepID=A0A813PTT1_9BILA|nr:unnamed protein product [Adineta steineri]
MGSRRGRLNWSNIEVHISDDAIDKQHRFNNPSSFSTRLASVQDSTEHEQEAISLPPPPSPPPTATATKRSWMPKKGVGEICVEEFVGNYMLTKAEQTAIDQKYNKKTTTKIECSNTSTIPKPIRISNRLPSLRDTPLSTRTTDLSVGQHLLNVFVCHVESYSCVYIMFGDDYNRATKLFQDMNNCYELIRPLNNNIEPKEKDLVAIHHENKWFRGRCLNSTDTTINILCIDSGATIICSKNDVRRLPDTFRVYPPCCIECSLSGLPTTISMSSMPERIHTQCSELLYKDRYEAIVTRLDSLNRPTIVLYYGDENINDRLITILKLL